MTRTLAFAIGLGLLLGAGFLAAGEPQLQIQFPLGRTAYQTNEWIQLALVRRGAEALPKGELKLTLSGDHGSKQVFTFALPAVAKEGNDAAGTEHIFLNGWLLRPGRYTAEAVVDGAAATAATVTFDVFTHLRKSSFKLVNWGRAQKADQLTQGEDGLGFNLFYGGYANDDEANFIRAGVDFMACCVMSGGHQMDLRQECDWSDPYVTRGGTARVVRRALIDRTRPNVYGVHFYDEPGLTWMKDPVNGQTTPHAVPSQARSYKSAFGEEPLSYRDVKADSPELAARWKQWAYWKLGFMDAAWKESQFGVSYVEPSYQSLTQSQYGFSAFTDGYYFSVVRCMPVASGHGGYDDWGPGYFNPSFTLEVARARDFTRPCWYLPTWYGNTPAERFRLEQYLSFMTNLQGMISPPDLDAFAPAKVAGAEGIVESNHLMQRLGPIFTTMPVTRPPVAMLYSLSHLIEAQVRNTKVMYAHDDPHGRNLPFTYLAGKLIQHQFLTVVDEDIVDGTLAADHKAVVLTSITYLDPKVVKALDAFAAKGGLVLLTGDCQVKIAGAVNLGVTPKLPDAELIAKLRAEKKDKEVAPYESLGKQMQGTEPLAKAIQAQLEKAGIKPVFECDQPGITATRQAAGDIEYFFAVNADCDRAGPNNNIRGAAATITLPPGPGPVYDAVRGGPAQEFRNREQKAALRFGPGEMRVFARTARPIGGVKAAAPVLYRDYTQAQEPLKIEIGAALVDAAGGSLSGSAPLRIRVTDPLGHVRYELYRASSLGAFRMTLPLAVNDPPGEWKVAVAELLGGTESTVSFYLEAVPQCGALAGVKERAVFFGADRGNVFRFFRVHQDVTLVTGTAPYNEAAAARLAESLKPWDVRCKIVKAAEVNKPREIPAEALATWVGLDFGRVDAKKYGPGQAGFAVQGPVVLLGSPEDNPLIKFAQDQRFLPYKAVKDAFPGRARGYVAWQRDCVGYGQESVTLIAYDAAGMSEAVGTAYELAAGLEPLTPVVPADTNTLTPATQTAVPQAAVAWQLVLPDRAVALQADGDRLTVTTLDGSLVEVDAAGKSSEPKAAPGPAKLAPPAALKPADLPKPAPAGRIPKYLVKGNDLTAVGYWGGLLQVYDAGGALKSSQVLPQDIAGLAFAGGKLVVALADGQLIALAVK